MNTLKHPYRTIPLRTAMFYLLFAGLWILFSDHLLIMLTTDAQTLNTLQTYKGLAFVIITGGMLYLVILRQVVRLERERTARRRVEDRMREHEILYRMLFDHTFEAVLVTDPNGGIIAANPAACAMFGRAEADLCRLGRSAISVPGDAQVMAAIDERRSTGRFRGELSLLRADGTVFPAECSATIFLDQYGQQRSSMIIRDLTDRKRAEQEIERFHDELERRVEQRTRELHQLNNELESFNYSVSHDLRAPIRAIDGYAAIMAEDHGEVLTPGARSLLGQIRANVKRMDQLINGLLSIARLTRQELRKQPVPMQEMMMGVIEELQLTEPGQRTKFITEPLPTVQADAVLLLQVWRNLLSNAVKYSQRSVQPEVRIQCSTAGGAWEFRVEDNGVGFEPALTDRLFGIFQRLHSVNEFEGIGVGLSIVKRIVERHGGTVRAEGRPGKGATFRFTLPV